MLGKIVNSMLTDEISSFLMESFSMNKESAAKVIKSLDFMTYHRIKESIDAEDADTVKRLLKMRNLFEGNAFTAAANAPSVTPPGGGMGGMDTIDLRRLNQGDEIVTPAGKKTSVKKVSNTGTGKLITTSDASFNIQTTPTPNIGMGPKNPGEAEKEIEQMADQFGIDVKVGDEVEEGIMTDVKSGMKGRSAPKIATPTMCQGASRNGVKTPGQLKKKLLKKKPGPVKGTKYDK